MSNAELIALFATGLAAAGFYCFGRLRGKERESQLREELAARNAELECLHAELDGK